MSDGLETMSAEVRAEICQRFGRLGAEVEYHEGYWFFAPPDPHGRPEYWCMPAADVVLLLDALEEEAVREAKRRP